MKQLFLFTFVCLSACQPALGPCDKEANIMSGLVTRVLDDRYLAYDSKQGEDLGRFGIRITSAEQYQRVFAYCCATRLDSINFTQYDVLGLSTVNRGSNSSYVWDVQRDDARKKVVYTVTERYCRKSSPVDGQGNFVLIPKIPTDFTVEYVRNQ